MSRLRPGVPGRHRQRGDRPGGIISYPLDKLAGEVAYIAYHFHWQMDDILEMEHDERHMWIEEISKINKKINETSKTPSERVS
ncbi:MAG TPA: DUF6760 family protein [Myxococcales bacterium]|nr:DUF6760 family protein [Myxococcales bacterium]